MMEEGIARQGKIKKEDHRDHPSIRPNGRSQRWCLQNQSFEITQETGKGLPGGDNFRVGILLSQMGVYTTDGGLKKHPF